MVNYYGRSIEDLVDTLDNLKYYCETEEEIETLCIACEAIKYAAPYRQALDYARSRIKDNFEYNNYMSAYDCNDWYDYYYDDDEPF